MPSPKMTTETAPSSSLAICWPATNASHVPRAILPFLCSAKTRISLFIKIWEVSDTEAWILKYLAPSSTFATSLTCLRLRREKIGPLKHARFVLKFVSQCGCYFLWTALQKFCLSLFCGKINLQDFLFRRNIFAAETQVR